MTLYTPFSLFQRQALLYPPSGPKYPGGQQFVDNSDGTISDLSTGLMWAKDGNGDGNMWGETQSWLDAMDYASSLVFAGYSGWRLPTIKELLTVVDYSFYNPASDPLFLNVLSVYYWTNTDAAYSSSYSWLVDFTLGQLLLGLKSDYNYVRLVRSI